jgi:hypothetical protein
MTTVHQAKMLERMPAVRSDIAAIKVLSFEYEREYYSERGRNDDTLQAILSQLTMMVANLNINVNGS